MFGPNATPRRFEDLSPAELEAFLRRGRSLRARALRAQIRRLVEARPAARDPWPRLARRLILRRRAGSVDRPEVARRAERVARLGDPVDQVHEGAGDRAAAGALRAQWLASSEEKVL